MGLKPPPREHVVATGRATAVGERWRGQAGRHAPVSDEADDAVEVTEDHGDQVLVVEAVVDEVGLIMSSMRWLDWCMSPGTSVRPLTSPARW